MRLDDVARVYAELLMLRDRLRRRRKLAGQRTIRMDADPTLAIRSPSDALAVAETLVEVSPRGGASAQVWQPEAVRPLAALLYAASPQGNAAGIAWVDRALDNIDTDHTAPGWYQAAQLCRENPAGSPGATALARGVLQVTAMSSRQRRSVWFIMREAVEPWLATSSAANGAHC